MGTRLLLVRHGHSRAEEDGIVGGHAGCRGLSARGRLQVQSLARRLDRGGVTALISAAYASVLPRAIETAEILTPTGGLVTDCGLCEIHEPTLDGRPRVPSNRRTVEDFSRPSSRGAESCAVFFERATSRLSQIAESHPDTTILVATHAGVIQAAMTILGGLSAGQGFQLAVDHASITELVYDPPRTSPFSWGLVRFNDAAHLDASSGLRPVR